MNNIAENPRGLSFQQVNAEVLPTVLDSVDVAVINGNYAIGAGLDLATRLTSSSCPRDTTTSSPCRAPMPTPNSPRL